MAEIIGTTNNDSLGGTAGNDYMYGLGGHDVLFGSLGADFIDGGAGYDGYDTVDYSFSETGVVVNLSVSRGFGGMAEGDFYVSIEGMAGSLHNDTFVGNGEYNEVYGREGNDFLDGGGNDDKLDGGAGHDILLGGSSNDWLIGGTGEDTLVGGEGRDFLEGGEDRDTADYGTSPSSVIIDLEQHLAIGGDATGDSFLSIENLAGSRRDDTLVGDAVANVLLGSYGNDRIEGRGGDDRLVGGDGNDVLIGDGGNDTMIGGTGDDWYYVDNALDTVSEGVGQGNDRVLAAVNFTLAAGQEIEKLTTADNFGVAAINLTGNELANIIYGNAGANTLDGKAGLDTQVGLGGDDWYFVDNAGDVVIEANGGGNDRVFAGVDYTLGAGREIEKLTTDNNGSMAPINLVGNEFANIIYGNVGSNALKGGLGADTLVGLGGVDAFVFNSTLGAGNIDSIADFNVVDDDVVLASWVFNGLSAGTLAASQFRAGSAAADADDRIIYNSTSGAVLFDQDGLGGGAAIQFATMAAGLGVTNADFIVV